VQRIDLLLHLGEKDGSEVPVQGAHIDGEQRAEEEQPGPEEDQEIDRMPFPFGSPWMGIDADIGLPISVCSMPRPPIIDALSSLIASI
jgi:hypothetical protein